MSQATLSTAPYRNSNLFSSYYLDERIEGLDAWDCDDAAADAFETLRELWDFEADLLASYGEDELLDTWIDNVLDALGFDTLSETTLPDSGGYNDRLLFDSAETRRDGAKRKKNGETEAMYGLASAVLEAKQWDADFTKRFAEQRSYRDASHQIKYYLEHTPERLQWGVLTDGRKWRLYGTKDYATETYYEIDLPELLESGDLEAFKYFYVFFRPEAFRETAGTSFLDTVWNESETAAQELGEDLQDNVFTGLRVLGKGFVETNDLDIDLDDEEALAELKEQSLVLLYRLMFVLYAESRHLIHPDDPESEAEFQENFSLDQLRLEIHEDIQSGDTFEEYSEHSTRMWGQLQDLFALIDEGQESLGIPPYNGGLFDDDNHEFLAENQVANRYIAEVIYRLGTTEIDDGAFVLADYADLDTRHLGTIYEGLLEHQFRIAPEQYAAVADDGGQVWQPATEVSVAEAIETVEHGELYVVNDDGERKATGSYYTPDYVVAYIVEETVDPLLDEIKEELAAEGLDPGDTAYFRRFWQAVLDLKVLDPAMGSGHFLTKATGYLTQEVMEVVREQEIQSYDEQHLRREIAKECIYGVDINGMAVELAKLSMWLETLAADQPLAFLDHHLKAGNSLVGSDITEVLAEDSEENGGQLTLTQAFARVRKRTLEHVMELMQDLLSIDNETLEDIKSMEEIYSEIRDDPLYHRLFQLANVHTAEQFGLDVPEDAYEMMADVIEDEDGWTEIEAEDWFVSAQATAGDQDFFHWELEYPDVFFDKDGEKRTNAGFDAVIGNPPYVKIQELRQSLPSQADYLAKNYQSATGNFDLYVCFTENGSDKLSDNGVLGYIEPHKFFQGNFGKGLREVISEDKSLYKVTSFGDHQVFEDATIYTCILLLSGSEQEEFAYTELTPEQLQTEEDISTNTIAADYTGDKWVFSPPHIADLLDKINRQGPDLVDVADKVFQGLATSADSVYILEEVEAGDQFHKVQKQKDDTVYELESGLLKPILKGDDSDRYKQVQPSLFVIFPYVIEGGSARFIEENELESEYPNIHEYLKSHEETLRQRESGKMDHDQWYDYVYPKNLTDYEESYIITPRLGNQPEFTYKPAGIYHNTDIEGIPFTSGNNYPEKYVLGVLNSSVFWFFMVNTGSTFRGGYYTFRSEYLYPFTIPSADEETSSKDELAVQDFLEYYSSFIENGRCIDQLKQWILSDHSFETMQTVVSDLCDNMMHYHDSLDKLNLRLLDHFGTYSDGQTLADVGLTQPAKGSADSILQRTAEEHPNLRVGNAEIDRESDTTVEIRLTARYKPEDEEEYETDQWGYTETEPLSALRITDLTEAEADLIEAFVPVAVDEAGGFANFRETATKTNSLVDRLRKLTLPAIADVREGLESYQETKARAEELTQKIDRTDDLIDEIVYELYGLTDEEIEIVENTVGD
ncbi:MAG: Eco57I restriction-modification methylase domain-containing protein [Halorientalis sp.]